MCTPSAAAITAFHFDLNLPADDKIQANMFNMTRGKMLTAFICTIKIENQTIVMIIRCKVLSLVHELDKDMN